MKVAILQRDEQNQAWEDQSASLDSEQVSEWSKEVDRWESNSSEPNPFESQSTHVLIKFYGPIYSINSFVFQICRKQTSVSR